MNMFKQMAKLWVVLAAGIACADASISGPPLAEGQAFTARSG